MAVISHVTVLPFRFDVGRYKTLVSRCRRLSSLMRLLCLIAAGIRYVASGSQTRVAPIKLADFLIGATRVWEVEAIVVGV